MATRLSLEDTASEQALAWVRQHNEMTQAELKG
jgi:prolyl oligopeptidase PreP (S9A serine peptidase family)